MHCITTKNKTKQNKNKNNKQQKKNNKQLYFFKD